MNRSRLVARLAAVLGLTSTVAACGPDAPTTPAAPAALVELPAGAQANAGGVTIAAPASTRLHPGDRIQLTGTVVLPNGSEKDKFPIKWSTSSAAVATVDEKTGEVTAVAPGAVTITAKAGPRTGQMALTVMVPVVRVIFSPSFNTMEWNTQGTSYGAAAFMAFDASGARILDLADRSIVWASSDPTTATVVPFRPSSPSQGLLTAVQMGKTTISVTVDGVEATVQLSVEPQFGYFNGGTYEQTLNVGGIAYLAMTFVSFDNVVVPVEDPNQESWVSTNPAVLTLTRGAPSYPPWGVEVTGVAPGTATIQGTYRGFTLSATITVVQ